MTDVLIVLPEPELFFPAAVLWTALTMALWYGFARDLGPQLSLGGLIGFAYPPADADGAASRRRDARATSGSTST